jgi:hypothetical protein
MRCSVRRSFMPVTRWRTAASAPYPRPVPRGGASFEQTRGGNGSRRTAADANNKGPNGEKEVPEQQHHGRRDDGLPAARAAAAADILAFVGQHLNKERLAARAAYAQRGTRHCSATPGDARIDWGVLRRPAAAAASAGIDEEDEEGITDDGNDEDATATAAKSAPQRQVLMRRTKSS